MNYKTGILVDYCGSATAVPMNLDQNNQVLIQGIIFI